MQDQIPGAGARWGERDEDDVIYYLREAEGDLGAGSSFGPMVDLALTGIPTGGNLSQHTEAQMRVRSPAAREAKVRALMRAIGPDHARVLARFYTPRLPPALRAGEGLSDQPYAGPPLSASDREALASEADKAFAASVPARLSTLAILTPEANAGYEAAYAAALRATVVSIGRIVPRGEQRSRALLAHPEVASVEAWLASLRLRAATGPGKLPAAQALAAIGEATRRLLASAQGAYAMSRKAWREPWRPNARAVAFQALFEVGG